jgi:hypothetical protein
VLILFIAIVSFLTEPQRELRETEDLQSHWKVLREGKFVDFDNGHEETIFLTINFDKSSGRYLEIQSQKEFYLFVNSCLVAKAKHLMFQADSLKRMAHGHAFISVHQPGGIDQLTTKWMLYQEIGAYDNPERPSRSFNNFILLAVAMLVIFFTGLLQSNPQLTTDYLNFTKLFTFKRRDDSQFVLRITSSVNLLFYFFCSLLMSLALITAVHFSERMSLSFAATFAKVGGYFGLWAIITLVIGAMLMLKLILASTTSLLFGWRDTAGFQFFNFIRGLVVALLLIGIISILAFSLSISVDYYFLVKCFFVMLATNAILMFFKLLNRESAGTFHLFSYLCATEFLPLFILIKVFLF